jgi:uncharacterized protein YqfA (UPF0365 family)
MDPKLIIIVAVGVVQCVIALYVLSLLPVWLRANRAKAPIPISKLVGLRLYGCPTSQVVDAYIEAKRAGATVIVDDIAKLWKASPRTFHSDVQYLITKKKEPNQPLHRNASTGSASTLKSPARRD